MRAVLFFAISALACGGRTLGDSIYDEGPFGGSGGSLSQGGSRPASTAGRGGRNAGGAAPGVGGTSSGGTFPKGGSFSGSGGGSLSAECKDFCSGFDRVCPNSLDFSECYSECSSGADGAGMCGGLVREALRCFTQATRALPSRACAAAQQALALSCFSHLQNLQRCGFELPESEPECKESASASPSVCEQARYCTNDAGAAVRCERGGGGRGTCSCRRADGALLFTESAPAPLERACIEARERCWAAAGL